LYQRERVQHLVVDHGGDLGPLGLPDPALALRPQLADHSPEQRCHRQRDTAQGQDGKQGTAEDRAETSPADRREHRDHADDADDDQRAAADQAQHVPAPVSLVEERS
jgi:hypothetical protein